MRSRSYYIALPLLFLICSSFYLQSTINNNWSKFDRSFNTIDLDTLHVYPTRYLSFPPPVGPNFYKIGGEIIDKTLLRDLNLIETCGSDKISGIGKFKMDDSGNTVAYLVGVYENSLYKSHVDLLIYSLKLHRFIAHQILAAYDFAEMTYERTTNSWILDEDGDGDFDIITKSWLTDYELPAEDAPNITGGQHFLLRFESDSLIYYGLDDATISHYVIRK